MKVEKLIRGGILTGAITAVSSCLIAGALATVLNIKDGVGLKPHFTFDTGPEGGLFISADFFGECDFRKPDDIFGGGTQKAVLYSFIFEQGETIVARVPLGRVHCE